MNTFISRNHHVLFCFWFLGCLFLCTSNPTFALASQGELQIAHVHLQVSLWPKKNKLLVKATLHLKGAQTSKKLRVYLGNLLRLTQAERKTSTGWKQIDFQRGLETAQLNFKKTSSQNAILRLSYYIVFFSKKNYLFRQIFCQIEPGDTHFLYGWYPSLHPFADSISGHLLGKERFRYHLSIEVPKGETAIASGPLLKQEKMKSGRTRFTFGSAKVSEAAIFFVSGLYQRVRQKGPNQTTIDYYLKSKERTRETSLQKMTHLIVQAENFYRREWGSPETHISSEKNQKAKRYWKVISFAGSGARGYPFSLLLERQEGYLFGDLAHQTDSLFTRRQVLLHEIAHTWWGNATTGKGEGTTWLNEGLANFASLRAIRALYGKKAENIARERHIRYFLASKGRGGLLDPGGLAQMAQRTAYSKGTLVFYELEHLLGKEVFRKGLRHFFQKNRGKFADVENLRKSFEKTSGQSLKSFFKNWIHGHGLPFIHLSGWSCPSAKQGCHLKIKLKNTGAIAGYAHIRIFGSNKQKKDLWIRVQANKTFHKEQKLPFRIRGVILDPDKIMLHGLRFKALIAQADELRQEGELSKAILLYQRVLQVYPRHGHALYGMARLYEKQGKAEKARLSYQKASHSPDPKVTPMWVPLWARFRQALLLQKKGERKQALSILKRLLKQPDNPYQLKERIALLLPEIRNKKRRTTKPGK